jgi:hypothetical protein
MTFFNEMGVIFALLDLYLILTSVPDPVGPVPNNLYLNQGFGSGSAWIRINLSCQIRIRIQIPDPDPF